MNGKQLAVILAFIGAAAVLLGHHSAAKPSEFESWKAKHSINFPNEFENAYREKVFLKNLAEIEIHNANEYRTYDMGLNQFSALTKDEFVQQYLTLLPNAEANERTSEDTLRMGDVDWVKVGAVTAVKDQGQCGSCWAFSATGGLEGLSKLNGELENFSEQQLVDCAYLTYGNQACNGGLMDNAFKYVKKLGITHQDKYPYVAKKQTCKIQGGDFKITGYVDIKTCDALANALTSRPISVAVDASNWSTYSGGIFTNCKASLNHGVTLTGMTENYWHVKNSWGAKWGESGYVRLARGNTCGICNQASYPTR